MKKWKIFLAASLINLCFFGGIYDAAGENVELASEEEKAEISQAMEKPPATYTAADKVRYDALREQNQGKEAEKQRFISTTAQKVVLTFGGLTRPEEVLDLLDRLDAMGTKATFFVTELEARKYADVVKTIVGRGHELGLGLRTSTDGDFYETCAQIERLQKRLSRSFGVRPVIARQSFGFETPTVNEACSAMGVMLLGQTLNLAQTKDKEAKSAEEIYPGLIGKSIMALGRGQIIYGRLDFLDAPKAVGQLLEMVKKDKVDSAAYRTFTDTPEGNPANDSAYHFASVGEVLADAAHLWAYPSENEIPYTLRPRPMSRSVTERNIMAEMGRRYIGAPSVNIPKRIRGFSPAEIKMLDTSGVIKSVADNTVFLTFDDWSTDRSINHLLYVLRKHHVNGTFFIITWNVKNNPNLLRAIAMEGHEIASHTHGHLVMAGRKMDYGSAWEKEYAKDLETSYQELARTIGDVTIDGRPALTRFLRPPTLAISRSGVKMIYNAGYSYIVSGYESTEDYAAPSLQAMTGAIQHGLYDEKGRVRKGSIIIMHMTDGAKYTAEALDYLLSVNEKRDDSDPKKFKVGLLSDYITDDYDQSMHARKDAEEKLSFQASCE